MVSKTDDIPASVPDCNPVDLADEAGDGAQDMKESSRTGLKESCGCGETVQLLLSNLIFITQNELVMNTAASYNQHLWFRMFLDY